MRRFTTFTTAAVAVGALALTAGCGPKQTASSSAQNQQSDVLALMVKDVTGTVRKVVDKTSKATSVAVSMTGTAAGKKIDGHGVVAFGSQPQAEITTTVDTMGETTVRMLGSVFYVQIPAGDRDGLNGKSWMKMDLSKVGANGGAMAKQFEDMDPSKQVRTLLDSGAVTAVGREKVGGVQTVHYAGTAPIAKYLGQLDTTTRSTVEQQLSAQGVTQVKIDLWVDDKYQPRRVHSVMGTTDVTADYTDYGKPVSVVAPPPSDTVDFDDLMKNLSSLTTGN
ncbi:hypothetical protein HC031_31280 [Planosporangium thailandense]|uniref:LppX_LprAFG lipoprotein n=1 Tax=Planosporangium thailandense TaxID=765197 RepID=A0ABX0Y802_9ACTN|nr:hypothetical protein [Planosporangium thailandense]NJC74163.1 hypothetical protein [Planosporangium thailandense]